MSELSHFDEAGRAKMVDITDKQETQRVAVARGRVIMNQTALASIKSKKIAKGDVLAVARVAAIMASKKVSELIPLCHPLLLSAVRVDFGIDENACSIEIEAEVSAVGKTGVEMEALTAVAVAALTIYDMCKAIDRAMRIDNIRLIRKSSGKSGEYVREE